MRFVIFDIWGQSAHFRPHYTTTSPITFPFPPQSTIIGIIGAIMGLERKNEYYLRVLQNTQVGVRILKYGTKAHIARTVVNTKDKHWFLIENKNHAARTLLLYQYLIRPAYRFYVHDPNDTILDDLVSKLLNGPVFCPYLGKSECLASFSFVKDVKADLIENSDFLEIVTPTRTDKILEKKLVGGKIVVEDMVVKMHPGRKSEYRPVLYSLDGSPLILRVTEAFRIPGDGYVTTF